MKGEMGKPAHHVVREHIVKAVLAFTFASFLLVACRHVESGQQPEKRSTEAEIHQHIVGEWTLGDKSDQSSYPRIVIERDGTFIGVLTNGTRQLIGTWNVQGRALRVTPSEARVAAARAAGEQLNQWDYFPVIYVDAHELIMTPGISVAGRWRFVR